MQARWRDDVAVAEADRLDAGAEDVRPGEVFGHAVQAYAGDTVVAAGGAPRRRQRPEAAFEFGEHEPAWLVAVGVDVDADDVLG